VFAHPDDAELTCFGTLAALSHLGADVSLLFLSKGERSRSPTAHEREEEARVAAAAIDATLAVKHLEDGAVSSSHETFSEVEHHIRRVQPDLVFTHFDKSGAEDHQDHQIVGRVVTNLALRYTKVAFLLQTEPPVAGSGFSPNVFIDVSRFFDAKLLAIESYRSEAEKSFMSAESVRERGRWWARQANPGNSVSEEYYEAFMMIRARIARPELAGLLAGLWRSAANDRES
jgi:LmbE family N-acetylglucosaminyl deacetylase